MPCSRLVIVALVVLLAGSGCAREDAIAEGPWRGEIELNGHQVPFNFVVAREAGRLSVTYFNAGEQLPVEEVVWEGPQLGLNFPSYSSTLTARVAGDALSGEIRLVRPGKTHSLPIRARHGATHRFFAEPAADAADLGGRWAMQLGNLAGGASQPAVALLKQEGTTLTGTVMIDTGDYRFLAGEVRGRSLYLSSFDGGGVQLWRGELDERGQLSGTFNSVTARDARWSAYRDEAATVADPAAMTTMKSADARLEFSFPDLDGRTVSLSDEKFGGKVVLVILAGSWCATCHDEARTMMPIYAEYASRGLEVVYLMYEYTTEFAAAEKQMRAWRARYGIPYPMLFVGDTARDTRGRALPMLTDVVAFPTSIFVDRNGAVRQIHTSFPGPATGAAHETYKADFRALVEQLLAEPEKQEPQTP